MTDKSEWDTLDWREWLDAQSEDAVAAELKWQYDHLTQAQARIKELEGLVRECWANQCMIKEERSQAQARIQELEGLVKEMADVMQTPQYSRWEKIFNRPLVKTIMEAKPCQE